MKFFLQFFWRVENNGLLMYIPISFEFFYVCHSCERGVQLFNRKISNLIGINLPQKSLIISLNLASEILERIKYLFLPVISIA